jgi:hypothetical protein
MSFRQLKRISLCFTSKIFRRQRKGMRFQTRGFFRRVLSDNSLDSKLDSTMFKIRRRNTRRLGNKVQRFLKSLKGCLR